MLYSKNTAAIEKYVPNLNHQLQRLLIFYHNTSKNSAYFDMDWDGCSINIWIWGGMDLDPTLRVGNGAENLPHEDLYVIPNLA